MGSARAVAGTVRQVDEETVMFRSCLVPDDGGSITGGDCRRAQPTQCLWRVERHAGTCRAVAEGSAPTAHPRRRCSPRPRRSIARGAESAAREGTTHPKLSRLRHAWWMAARRRPACTAMGAPTGLHRGFRRLKSIGIAGDERERSVGGLDRRQSQGRLANRPYSPASHYRPPCSVVVY